MCVCVCVNICIYVCVCVCMLGAVPGGQKALCLATVTFDSHISSEIYLYLLCQVSNSFVFVVPFPLGEPLYYVSYRRSFTLMLRSETRFCELLFYKINSVLDSC